jgi:hypothetical protein
MTYGENCSSRQKRVKYTANATARPSHVVPCGSPFNVRGKNFFLWAFAYSHALRPAQAREVESRRAISYDLRVKFMQREQQKTCDKRKILNTFSF